MLEDSKQVPEELNRLIESISELSKKIEILESKLESVIRTDLVEPGKELSNESLPKLVPLADKIQLQQVAVFGILRRVDYLNDAIEL